MKNRILTLIAVMATAGLIMAWGCGGKAVMGAGEGILDNGSVPFVATTSGGTSSPEALGLTKDIDTSGSGAPSGQVNSEGESADVTCEFQWDDATNDGGGIVTPVITIKNEYTPEEMKAVCEAEATCGPGGDEPCGYSALNCIGCINEYLFMEGVPPEPEYRDATLYCAGNVPNHYTSDAKFIKARLICHPLLSAGDVDVDHTWAIETLESKAPWLEINTVANLLGVDIILNTDKNNPALGSFFDLSFNSDVGDPLGEHPRLVPAPDDPASVVDPYDPMATSRKGILYMDITAKGSETPQVFDFDRTIETPLSLEGVTGGMTILNRGRLFLGWSLCDNRDIGCAPITSWLPLGMVGSFKSATGAIISDGSTGVDISGVGVNWVGTPPYKFYTASIGAFSFMEFSYDKVFYSVAQPLAGEVEPLRFFMDTGEGLLTDTVYFPIDIAGGFSSQPFQAYKYALRPLSLTVASGVLGDANGVKFSIQEPYSITIEPMCSGTENWDVNSLAMTPIEKMKYDCWIPALFTNDTYASSYADLETPIKAGVVTYYEDNVDYTKNAIDLNSAPMFNSGKTTLTLSKLNITEQNPDGTSSIKMDIKNISGFATEGDAFLVRLADQTDASDGYLFGIRKEEITSTVVLDGDIDFVAGDEITPTVNGIPGSLVKFNDWGSQSDTLNAVGASIYQASGGDVESYSVTGQRQLTINFYAAGSNTISLAITGAEPPDPVYVSSSPVKMACIAYPYNGGTVLDSACDGATSVTLILHYGKKWNMQNMQLEPFADVTYKTNSMQFQATVSDLDVLTFTNAPDLSVIFHALDNATSLRLDSVILSALDVENQMPGPAYDATTEFGQIVIRW